MIAISLLAETGRTPFDLPEAESEIVAGHLTETSATIFLFLYLAEYNAILFYSCFMAMLFLGGSDYSFFEPVLNIFSISNISSNFFLYSLFSLPVIASGL
jgi:NADH-ubiquinone oxidoreductase chain 1